VSEPSPPFVSTGHLPRAEEVARLVAEAHGRFRDHREGTVSRVYPALARVDADLFGIAVVSVAGPEVRAGDAAVPFTIMSVSKPFVFALACQLHGADVMWERVGANATGLPFDSAAAVDQGAAGRTNPMVNPGAIATSSFAPGADSSARTRWVVEGLSRFAGRELEVDAEVFASASAANGRNQGLARLLATLGRLGCDPGDAVATYTHQCCLAVSAADLAVMGATLAAGGVNPRTGEQVVDAESCHAALAVMATAGLYDTSGDWLFQVGLPGKSGIGGGIVTVAPGKGALATFAPPLDAAGNSVRGQLVARFLSRRLGLDVFAGAVDAGA